ncbi:MAG TPA: hypothetical protein PLF42_00315 [Anaerolineales bacterium]|nr:hypothetical protein [Anaerolineales bacterium]
MDQKTKGIIATVAAVLLCGCPGLFVCVFGAASAFGGGTYNVGSDVGSIPPTVGFVLICLSLIMVLIPVGVGFAMFRKKPGEAVAPSDEPLPPVS